MVVFCSVCACKTNPHPLRVAVEHQQGRFVTRTRVQQHLSSGTEATQVLGSAKIAVPGRRTSTWHGSDDTEILT